LGTPFGPEARGFGSEAAKAELEGSDLVLVLLGGNR
jgi:hypothetical protein